MIKLRYVYNWIIVADDRREKSELGAEAVWEKGEGTVCQMQRKKNPKLMLASAPTEKTSRQEKCEER